MKSKPHTKRLIKLLYTVCECNSGGGGGSGSIPKPFMRQKSVETYLKKFPAGIRFFVIFYLSVFFSSPTSDYYTTTSCTGGAAAAAATTTTAAIAAVTISSLGAYTYNITILSGVSIKRFSPGAKIPTAPFT